MAIQRNKAEIVGWAGHDAELKKTAHKGLSMATLNVATHRFSKVGSDGSSQSETEWHRCVFFSHLAERAANIKKGDRVAVDGRIIPRLWKDKQGSNHRSVEIHVHSLQIESKVDQEKAPETGDDAPPPPEPTNVQEEL